MMSNRHDPLDEALARLPRDVEPSRDLWRDIRAEITAPVPLAPRARRVSPRTVWYTLAAAAALIFATSLVTWFVMRDSMQQPAAPRIVEEFRNAAPLEIMPVSFAGDALGANYAKARASLDAEFER